MFFREGQFARQVLSHDITVQQRNRARALFQQLGHERIRDCRLAGSRQSREEDRKALLVFRRMRFAKFLNDLRVGEPLGNVETFAQAPTKLGAGEVQDLVGLLRLVGREVLGLVLDVDHHLERHHCDVEFLFVLPEEFLRIVRSVERVAVLVVAGARMIAADDEVRAAIVLAHDRMQKSFAWPAHAHGEIQQAQLRRLLGVLLEDVLIAAHAREVIDVARLGHADDRVNQQIRIGFAGRTERQFLVRPVQRVPGLESNDLAPSQLAETTAQLRRGVPEQLEVIVGRRLDAMNPATEIDRVRDVLQVVDCRVRVIGRAVDTLGLAHEIGRPDVADLECREQHTFRVAERDLLAFLEFTGKGLCHVERDRQRPEHATGEPHGIADTLVVVLAEKAF